MSVFGVLTAVETLRRGSFIILITCERRILRDRLVVSVVGSFLLAASLAHHSRHCWRVLAGGVVGSSFSAAFLLAWPWYGESHGRMFHRPRVALLAVLQDYDARAVAIH